MRSPERICPTCGVGFVATVHNKKFCSVRCQRNSDRAKAARAKWAKAYRQTPEGREAHRAAQARYRARHPERVRETARVTGKRRRDARRKMLDAIKVEAGCVDCGFNAHPAALEFDHRDPATKSFEISVYRPWADVLAEIAKCDVRCANCHRIKTVENGDYLPRGIA